MPKASLRVSSILGGISPTQYFGSEGQFTGSLAVDPDLPLSDSNRTSGALVPVGYSTFATGATVATAVIAIINNPKNTLTYVVTRGGKILSYDSSFGSETTVGTVSGGVANGAFYYNNYIYITTTTDVSRYGPLDGAPSLVDGVWTGATLGSLTALTNTTYPTIDSNYSIKLPNHWGCIHGDGAAYFLDFKNGQGLVHKIKTTKTTAEGDTNNGSAYNVLDLPFGFYPTAISSYSTDIAILAIQSTDGTINQGRAALFLWDTTNTDTFYRGPIYLPDPLATAMLYLNGALYIWSGNAQNGTRVSIYAGGDSVSDVAFLEEGKPPLPGAVDGLGNRIAWAGYTTYPTASACVYALGSKNNRLPKGINSVARAADGATPSIVTAIKYTQQDSNVTPKVIMAWQNATNPQVSKFTSSPSAYESIWRSQVFNINKLFDIDYIRIPLGSAIASGTTITAKIYFDDQASSVTLTTINNSNFPSAKYVSFKNPDLGSAGGRNSFFIELAWTGTVGTPVLLPIEIGLDVKGDEALYG